jgi:hypothetical protein
MKSKEEETFKMTPDQIIQQIIARIEQYEADRLSPHSTIDDIKLILAGYDEAAIKDT